MTKPIRLKLSRAKGFSLQVYSLSTNDLQAVNVARPSRFGNPFTVDGCRDAGFRGKNLACWCELGAPFHADVLLELANSKVRP